MWGWSGLTRQAPQIEAAKISLFEEVSTFDATGSIYPDARRDSAVFGTLRRVLTYYYPRTWSINPAAGHIPGGPLIGTLVVESRANYIVPPFTHQEARSLSRD